MPSIIDALAALVGAAHVVTDPTDLAAQSANVLHGAKGLPRCIVWPATTQEVAAVVRCCAAAGVAIVPLGGNTGLSGGTVPLPAGDCVMIGLRRLNRILDLSTSGNTITVQAGCILADVQAAAAGQDRLFPLSLGAEGSCQIGGNIATNASGVNALRYGVMRDLVLGLEVVLPDGTVLDMMRALRKDNAGYDLKHLFIGSGGTLGIVTAAVPRLAPLPRHQATALMALRDADAALALLGQLTARFDEQLVSAELMDALTLRLVRDHAKGVTVPYDTLTDWHLLVEIAGPDAVLADHLTALLADALEDGQILDATLAQNSAQSANLWAIRHATAEVARQLGPRYAHDVSVPVASLPAFVAELARRLSVWPELTLMIFGHVGDGNLHVLTGFPGLKPGDPTLAGLRVATDDAVTAAIVAFGGSVTAEHGIGLNYLHRLVASRPAGEIALMQALRRAVDPMGVMNPGKVLP